MAKKFIVAILLLYCAGCAINQKVINNNPPYSTNHIDYDNLDVNWQAQRTATGISISGTVRNTHSYSLQNLELTIRLMDEQGNDIARETYVSFPDYLAPDEPASFNMEFHLSPGMQASRVHFSYMYWEFQMEPAFRVYVDDPQLGTVALPL